MAFNLVFECAIDQSDRSIITHVSRGRRKRHHFSFFFFLIYFSLFFPNPFVSPPLPLLSHSRKSIQRNFYVIKKYFGLSILILITSWQTFKWGTKIISFVYLPCLGIIERSFPFLLFIFDRYRFPRDYDVRIRTICEISTIHSFYPVKFIIISIIYRSRWNNNTWKQ